MQRLKKFEIPLSENDVLDVTLQIELGEVTGFSLNYRARIGKCFFEVYRVDTMHGFLHEQRYWLTPEPIPVPAIGRGLNDVFNFYLDHVKSNFERYRGYYLERMNPR